MVTRRFEVHLGFAAKLYVRLSSLTQISPQINLGKLGQPGKADVQFSRKAVHLVNLDPTVGSEIQKTRPCLVVSPNEMNRHVRTVIVAPMTTKGQASPTRVPCRFQGKAGQVVLDQIWTVDRARLVMGRGEKDKEEGIRAHGKSLRLCRVGRF